MKWDLEYIAEHMPTSNLTVIISKDHNFKYVNEKKLPQDPHMSKTELPTRWISMSALEFQQRIKSWKEGDERYTGSFFSTYISLLPVRYIISTGQLVQKSLITTGCKIRWIYKQKRKLHLYRLLSFLTTMKPFQPCLQVDESFWF